MVTHARGHRLFEVAKQSGRPEPLTDCTDLVPVDPSRCPTCGSPVSVVGWAQPALFYFGGYGATVMRTKRRCQPCGFELPYDETSLNPRRT